MLLLVSRCITRLILVNYNTALHCKISIICLFSNFVFSLARVHSVPAVLLFALLVSGHSLFEQFEFDL